MKKLTYQVKLRDKHLCEWCPFKPSICYPDVENFCRCGFKYDMWKDIRPEECQRTDEIIIEIGDKTDGRFLKSRQKILQKGKNARKKSGKKAQ